MQYKTENRILVNGLLLSKNIGKEVSVIGTVISASPDGSSFEIKTSDKHVITAIVRQPQSQVPTGLIEVQGVARTKDSIVCNYHIAFPDELSHDYDADIANEVAVLMNTVSNPWKQ